MKRAAVVAALTSVALLAMLPTAEAQKVLASTHAPSRDNYSGWDSTWTEPSVGDSITASWRAVPMDCAAGSGEASPWPGMGDTQTTVGTAAETNLAQLGYDMDCTSSGKETYTAWTEFIHNGNDPGEIDYPADRIHQGDVLSARLTWKGRGLIDSTMSNRTAGWTIDRPMQFARNYVPDGVETIMEKTSDLPMARFSPVTFTTTIVYHGIRRDYADAPELHSYDSRFATTSDLSGRSWTSTFGHSAGEVDRRHAARGEA